MQRRQLVGPIGGTAIARPLVVLAATIGARKRRPRPSSRCSEGLVAHIEVVKVRLVCNGVSFPSRWKKERNDEKSESRNDSGEPDRDGELHAKSFKR
jgi:hypothetical protein